MALGALPGNEEKERKKQLVVEGRKKACHRAMATEQTQPFLKGWGFPGTRIPARGGVRSQKKSREKVEDRRGDGGGRRNRPEALS